MRLVIAAIITLASTSCTHAQTGLLIKTVAHSKMTGTQHGLGATENTGTIYVDGPRLRSEWSRPTLGPVVTIQRCDKRVRYILFPELREYAETAALRSPDERKEAGEEAHQKWSDGPPNLIIEATTVDTGEAKQAFGHTAHHYIITTRQIPLAGSQQEQSQTVEDVWFLDMPDVMNCEPVSHRPRGLIGTTVTTRVGKLLGDPRTLQGIRPEFRYSGPDPQGLVLSSTQTTQWTHVLPTGEKQNTEFITAHEIVQMSNVSVDPALFEVPLGFTKVSHQFPSKQRTK